MSALRARREESDSRKSRAAALRSKVANRLRGVLAAGLGFGSAAAATGGLHPVISHPAAAGTTTTVEAGATAAAAEGSVRDVSGDGDATDASHAASASAAASVATAAAAAAAATAAVGFYKLNSSFDP